MNLSNYCNYNYLKYYFLFSNILNNYCNYNYLKYYFLFSNILSPTFISVSC